MSVEIRELRDEEVASLTQMWNESDSIWPGGFTSGMPLTLERMRLWNRSTEYLAPFVAVEDGRLVGFGGLTRQSGEPDVAYVSVLGVHPSVLSRGYGRDLLRATVARSTQLGFGRLDLDTWGANTRAIPLYKRTGFLWVPDTSVNMQNFLPTLLRHPLVKEFLAGEDWYNCFKPRISLEEDAFVQGGVPAFPYEFERDGRRLSLWLAVGSGEILSYEDEG
ncbi:MAG: GNAT family N-acetyltransferase, partial [Chloroflexota bacterium]